MPTVGANPMNYTDPKNRGQLPPQMVQNANMAPVGNQGPAKQINYGGVTFHVQNGMDADELLEREELYAG